MINYYYSESTFYWKMCAPKVLSTGKYFPKVLSERTFGFKNIFFLFKKNGYQIQGPGRALALGYFSSLLNTATATLGQGEDFFIFKTHPRGGAQVPRF